jgi:hypothetical protein
MIDILSAAVFGGLAALAYVVNKYTQPNPTTGVVVEEVYYPYDPNIHRPVFAQNFDDNLFNRPSVIVPGPLQRIVLGAYNEKVVNDRHKHMYMRGKVVTGFVHSDNRDGNILIVDERV